MWALQRQPMKTTPITSPSATPQAHPHPGIHPVLLPVGGGGGERAKHKNEGRSTDKGILDKLR